jgi:hypothetical protein
VDKTKLGGIFIFGKISQNMEKKLPKFMKPQN